MGVVNGTVFICYRREDAVAYAGRLHDRLTARFGKNRVFMDIDNIQPGEDFIEVLENRIAACDVVVAIIGKAWLTSVNDEGTRRLDDPDDYVRREIAAALDRQIRVIPALVGGARIPRSTDLPADIAALSRRHAIEISDTSFQASVEKLIEGVEVALNDERERRDVAGRIQAAASAEALETAAEAATLEPVTNESRPGVARRFKLIAAGTVPILAFLLWAFLPRQSSEPADAPGSIWTNPAPPPSTVLEPVAQPEGTEKISPQDSRPAGSQSKLREDLAPMRVGGQIKEPIKVKDVRPIYPPIAQSARVQGIVIIEATIGTDGSVRHARVIRSVALLDEAALDAVGKWLYRPTVLNGVSVPVIMTVTVNFNLQTSKEVVLEYVAQLESRGDSDTAVEMLRRVFQEYSIMNIFTTLRTHVEKSTDEVVQKALQFIRRDSSDQFGHTPCDSR